MDNNYIEKLVIDRLSQIIYDFYNICRIITGCYTLCLIFKYKSINYWIDNKLICLIIFYLGLWFIFESIY
jgi:hypothetical protein